MRRTGMPIVLAANGLADAIAAVALPLPWTVLAGVRAWGVRRWRRRR